MAEDFTHGRQYLPELVGRIESGADLVVGEGVLQGEESRPHRLLRRWAPMLLRSRVGVRNVHDVVSGYMAFTLTRPARLAFERSPEEYGLAFESVTFPSRVDGLQMDGWLLPAAGAARRPVVIVHGKSSDRQREVGGRILEIARTIVRDGHPVLMFDMRGSGRSAGERFTLGAEEVRDVGGAVDFLEERGLAVPATPVFADAVERLAAEGRHAPDAMLAARRASHTFVAGLASASRTGVLRWLLMDTFDIAEAAFERGRDADKQRLLDTRADQRDQERQARDERIKAKEQLRREKDARRADEQRAKSWRKWRHALSPRKQVARLKGSVKQILGSRQP
jgi:pimeloyl-ACP methyl ester carboxylesterase